MLIFLSITAVVAAMAMLVNMAIPDGAWERRRMDRNRRELERLYDGR